MKKNSIKILYRLFSFLTDKTNGFKPFAKYKLVCGTLLIGVTTTSCSNANSPKVEEANEVEIVQPTCYEPTAPIEEDTIPVQQVQKQKISPIPPSIPSIPPIIDEVMCYYPSDSIYSIPPPPPIDSVKNKIDTSHVYKIVDKMPQFPGGNDELREFIQENIQYPEISRENGIEGRVVVSFVVDETGKIAKVKMFKGLDKYLDEEAISVVSSMPNWIPGEQNGRKVKVEGALPVVFKLDMKEN